MIIRRLSFFPDKVKNVVAIVAKFLYRPALVRKVKAEAKQRKPVFGLKKEAIQQQESTSSEEEHVLPVVVIKPEGIHN